MSHIIVMISNQRQQFRFSRFVWQFLRDGAIDVADFWEVDDGMGNVITSVCQAKTAEDISHLEQLFVVSEWNDVILASDHPVRLVNRDIRDPGGHSTCSRAFDMSAEILNLRV